MLPKDGWDIHIPPKGKSLDKIEKEAVLITLRITDGNQSETAKILGRSRPTLTRLIATYCLKTELDKILEARERRRVLGPV